MYTRKRHVAGFVIMATALGLTACGGGGTPPASEGFTLGGTVSGLAANGSLLLQNNSAVDVTVAANGGFTFGSRVPAGALMR